MCVAIVVLILVIVCFVSKVKWLCSHGFRWFLAYVACSHAMLVDAGSTGINLALNFAVLTLADSLVWFAKASVVAVLSWRVCATHPLPPNVRAHTFFSLSPVRIGAGPQPMGT